MSRRRVKLLLLCEDTQHEAFLRRFFKRAGWHPRAMRVEKSPKGRGAGEQWVRERYPKELDAHRQRHVSAMIAVMVDADVLTVEDRLEALDAACSRAGIAARDAGERVAVFVPRRNIETWIEYLSGNDVDEAGVYPKLRRERECAEPVRRLKGMCDAGELRDPAPPSLTAACTEYKTRIPDRD